jgi:hypothetical protein
MASAIDCAGQMNAIAAFDKHAQRGVEIFAFIGTIEGIGEQHDLAAVLGAERDTARREHVAAEFRQVALGADAGNLSNSARSRLLWLRRLAAHGKRDASPA